MQLVSDILDISLIESGQLVVNPKSIDLRDLSTKVYHTHEHALQEAANNNVRFILDIPPKPVIVETDAIRIEQVLSNLLSNAIKFTTEGYIKFGYTFVDDCAMFFVEDTGKGIKEEFQPEVFNRFVKNEDNSDDKFARGAGIGLSLSKELVNILGGTIWFISVYHEGTTFYFTIPLHKSSGTIKQ
jgi:signal transduction histidine kinase